jgi:prepilin-type N-terminal cleavage/methylation domain-containing protein
MNGKSGAVQRGFTLLEMIMVVSIILFLLGTLVVFVSNAHLESQKQETRKIIDGVEAALVTYYDEWGSYPPRLGITTANPSDRVEASALLCAALTGSGGQALSVTSSNAVSSLESLPAGVVATDPTYGAYIVDAWHNPIICVVYVQGSASAEANGGMPFVYSCGPDGQCGWTTTQACSPAPAMTDVDADNISNFRDLPSTPWKYTP